MRTINASIGVDQRLYRQDIEGSIAHVRMLAAQNILHSEDAVKIEEGLKTLLASMEAGTFVFREDLEDIHMNVEAALAETIGVVAGRLHTARSRNDQVATDFRLWVRDALDVTFKHVRSLQGALVVRALEQAATLMPGFTHLQSAQPVTFGHHLMAYVEMLGRDAGRLKDARARLNECPLGSAALAGTSFPLDRHMTAKALGFDGPMNNSLDGVSSRDFALEAASAASILMAHLSRFAEELVLWTTPQFGFIKLSDRFTTGSSIMPQKRNPDAAELVRGKTGRVFGQLMTLLTMMKALPLAYAKDLQEDKQALFDIFDTLDLCLAAMEGMVRDMQVNPQAMKRAAGSGYATATDLADWLVRVLGMPFRDAHHVTGRVVALAEQKGLSLERLSLAELQTIEPRVTQEVFGVLSVANSVKSRTSYGGTAPQNVRKQARRWLAQLKREGVVL